ncbi:MAG: hypothetical protein COU71_00190 [Parcubacteria group bacterium CG10_big_fil_rev_8_21_14_0_10_38_31]|nr:MAG: hypothetical protein COU71_00190 [Parcubacteria group bacterium CG10_big_fil_rev_8_21_14_0_10_38_31]
MKFTYKAKKITGEESSGEIEAKDRFELAKDLKADGYILTSYKEKKDNKFFLSFSILNIVPMSEKMIFARNLAVMINAGLSATRSLSIIARQTKNVKFKETVEALKESIQKGKSISESMALFPKIFSSLFVAMVKMGEESGKLSEALEIIGIQLERDWTLKKKIKGAMIYPTIVVIALIIIGILLLVFVVPTLVSTFSELQIELPLSTRIIIGMSNFLVNNTLIALILSATLFSLVAWVLRLPKGKRLFEYMLLRFPIISPLVKKINSARTARTLSSLTGSGVKIIEALDITTDVIQNSYYKEVIIKAKSEIQKGSPVSKIFQENENLYPVLVGEMMAVGEETGKFSEMLERVADFYEEEVNNTTKNLSTVIEPLLMVVVGAVVGFFAVSMISPMYSMAGGL